MSSGTQVRGRVGFDSLQASAAEIRRKICERHNIEAARFRVELTDKVTGQTLADDSVVQSYTEVDVGVFRITLSDVVAAEKQAAVAAASRPKCELDAEIAALVGSPRASGLLGAKGHSTEADRRTGALRDPQRSQRMLAIANYSRLPLNIVAMSDLQTGDTLCALCRIPSDAAASVTTECCGQFACEFCIGYAKSLQTDDALCPICGAGGLSPSSITTAKTEPHAAVKDESCGGEAAKGRGLSQLLGLLPAPLAECKSDDDETDPLYTMLDTPPWKKKPRIEA